MGEGVREREAIRGRDMPEGREREGQMEADRKRMTSGRREREMEEGTRESNTHRTLTLPETTPRDLYERFSHHKLFF